MPSTARVAIAQLNSANVVTESLDDVWNTQYGRHVSIELQPDSQVLYSWPSTGESSVYLVVSSGIGGTFQISFLGTSQWIVNVPPLKVKARFLLPQPAGEAASSFSLQCSADAEVFMVFF